MPNNLVFAADALVRFKGGRIVVHTTASKLPAFESDNPMLIGWLCQFARPHDADAALGALNPADRAAAAEIIGYLRRSEVLVVAELQAKPSIDETSSRTRLHLRALARSVYDSSCDILGLGPEAESALAARTGIGVERRLMALLAGVDALREELRQLRAPHIRSQLQNLGVAPGTSELKLHIGCGRGIIAGWVNIDIHPAPLAMNVLWGLPFEDGSARYIFVSHLLEHLFYPADVQPFLAEIRRVLAPSGVVRFVVPDIEQCIEAYVKSDRSFFASRRETWSWWPESRTRLEDFLAYAGAGADPAYLFESHKYGYDFETLHRILLDAGFTAIVRSGYMQSTRDALRVDDASAVAGARHGDRHYSLFVEAQASSGGERSGP